MLNVRFDLDSSSEKSFEGLSLEKPEQAKSTDLASRTPFSSSIVIRTCPNAASNDQIRVSQTEEDGHEAYISERVERRELREEDHDGRHHCNVLVELQGNFWVQIGNHNLEVKNPSARRTQRSSKLGKFRILNVSYLKTLTGKQYATDDHSRVDRRLNDDDEVEHPTRA